MRPLLLYVLTPLLAVVSLTACGTKGDLKTPTQMELDAAKKAKKEAEKAAKEKAEEKTPQPPAPESK